MPSASASYKVAGPSSSNKAVKVSSRKGRKDAAGHRDNDDDLDALFQASLKAYEEVAQADKAKRQFSSTEDIIRLDGSVDEVDVQRKRRQGDAKTAQGEATSVSLPLKGDVLNDKGKRKAIDVHLDRLQSEKALESFRGQGKRAAQRQNREDRAKTAGSDWYDMPAFPTDDPSSKKHGGPSAASSRYTTSSRGPTAEEMRREVQAIRLRNAMDPKRFYKGGSIKDKAMPAFAQLGRIIASPLEPKSNLTRAERGRSVVEELIKDAEVAAYAKRKYGEHQIKAAAGGRGHSKAKTRKPGDRKKQRR